MAMKSYICPDCNGGESVDNGTKEISTGSSVIYAKRPGGCNGCGGTGMLTEVEAINRKLIPNPMFG